MCSGIASPSAQPFPGGRAFRYLRGGSDSASSCIEMKVSARKEAFLLRHEYEAFTGRLAKAFLGFPAGLSSQAGNRTWRSLMTMDQQVSPNTDALTDKKVETRSAAARKPIAWAVAAGRVFAAIRVFATIRVFILVLI